MADTKKDREGKKETAKDAAGLVGGAFAGGAVGGVAGGAMAGAAAGGLGGPAGAAIGAAVGAVAGAIGGKAIANRINPTAEDEHWRSTYASQPYVAQGSSYDDYGPAYKLGYERYPDYHGRSFDDAEPELQRHWESQRGDSRLTWDEARHATRDAFDRARDTVTRDDPDVGVGETQREVVDDLDELLRGELAALETYRQGLDKLRRDYGHDAGFQQLARMQQEHEQAADQLRTLIVQFGGSPSADSGAWGTWSNTVMGAARILGDKAALTALANGEESGLEDYQEVLKRDRTPDKVRHLLRSLVGPIQERIQVLRQMIDVA